MVVLSSLKSAKETLERGIPPCWGQIVHVAEKHDHFGIGYPPFSRLPDPKNQKNFNPVRFNNAGFQSDHTVAVIDDTGSSKREVLSFMHKCPPGFNLNN